MRSFFKYAVLTIVAFPLVLVYAIIEAAKRM